MEHGGSVIREEPRRQEVWWDGTFEALLEAPLVPEPVEIMRDLIQFEQDLALVPGEVFGDLEDEAQLESELSLILEEFTTEKEWGQHNGEVLLLLGTELRGEELGLSGAKLSASDKNDQSKRRPVGGDDESLPPAPSLMYGWELISSDPSTERVLHRLAYVRRFVNSCRRKFRPMLRELSSVEMDLARKQLSKLSEREVALWGETSVGWTADSLQ
jgi:hypothetical protein